MNNTNMTRELRQLARGILIAFGVVLLASMFYGVVQSKSLTSRSDNPRRVIAEQTLQRGMIVDRNGVVLATSSPTNIGDRLRRIYPYPEMIGGVGYFSYTHGASGLEATFGDLLRGEWQEFGVWDELTQDLLHQQPDGGDLRTTLDLRIQQAITESIGNRNGAAVVIQVPDGAVLAMVSQYTLDPNALDENWDEFAQIQRQRLIHNRVTEGLYRPGSIVELVTLIGMLANGDSLDRVVENGTLPVSVGGTEFPANAFGCVDERAAAFTDDPLLKEALAWGCPQPFVQAFGESLTAESYDALLRQLGLLDKPELYDFRTVVGRSPVLPDDVSAWTLEALGQGNLRVTPLQLARLVAAIANDGSAPPLYIADAYRMAGEREWQALDRPLFEKALMRDEIAQQLRDVMRFAAENSLLVKLANDTELSLQGYVLHGQVGVSYINQQMNSWFLGFMDAPDGSSVVVVVLIENAESPGEAAVVAGDAFQTTIATQP